jgi:hypothetical protein
MKTKRIYAALLSLALMLNISTAVSASATDNDDNIPPVLCEAAYDHLEQDRGLTRQEVDQMLAAMSTRSNTTYVTDYIFNVSCTSLSNSTTHSFIVGTTYGISNISYFDIVEFGTISDHDTTISGNNKTDVVTVDFNSTGKVLTYRYTIANSGVIIDLYAPLCLYTGDDVCSISNALALGDVFGLDNVVDVSDYISLCNYLAEDPNTTIHIANADVDQNGSIGWSDAYQLEDYIMKRINHIWG